jgi:hypothetical protein
MAVSQLGLIDPDDDDDMEILETSGTIMPTAQRDIA